MKKSTILLLRAILAVVLAFLIARVFFPGRPLAYPLGLAAAMFCLAYLFQYSRKREKGGRDDQ